jgi:hypothetical protein
MHHARCPTPSSKDARGLVHVPNPEHYTAASTMLTASTRAPGRAVLEVDPRAHRRRQLAGANGRTQTCTKCGGAVSGAAIPRGNRVAPGGLERAVAPVLAGGSAGGWDAPEATVAATGGPRPQEGL